ncbi:MAG: serine acetyltransferase [Paludibacteraceae bacterium]
MITDKTSYHYYLKRDLEAYGLQTFSVYNYFRMDCLRYQRRLRKIEYLYNVLRGNFLCDVFRFYLEYANHRLATRLGLTVPKNVFGAGLCIVHPGTLVVSPLAKVGENCRVHPSSCIGEYNGAPVLGDNVYIAPGAKLFGDICIGNNVAIGANAVVNRSFPDNVTIGGIPARVLSQKSTIDAKLFPKNFLKEIK